MSTGEFERSPAAALTALPSLDQLRRSGDGFDEESVREAFEAFRRHTTQLQAQLRVLQAARKTASVDPTGHAVRMDALHLIRAAAEFADVLERDAQTASAAQLQRTEEEVRAKQRDLQDREAEIERYRNESERQRAEIVNTAKAEARDLLAKAHADATRELRDAETRGNRLLEQSRHQATELTNSARAEVEQTLEWARAQAGAVMARAQKGAEQLLAAAGLGEPAIGRVVESILAANEREAARSGVSLPARPAEPAPAAEVTPAAAPTPTREPTPAAEPPSPTEPPQGASSPGSAAMRRSEPDEEPEAEQTARPGAATLEAPTPPISSPPAAYPPVSTPPVSTPPVSTPPVSTPPVSEPQVSTPPATPYVRPAPEADETEATAEDAVPREPGDERGPGSDRRHTDS